TPLLTSKPLARNSCWSTGELLVSWKPSSGVSQICREMAPKRSAWAETWAGTSSAAKATPAVRKNTRILRTVDYKTSVEGNRRVTFTPTAGFKKWQAIIGMKLLLVGCAAVSLT